MALKVGEVLEKVSELKSKKAIASQIVMYLQAHYLSSDTGSAEMRITRDDSHMVPEEHVKAFINDLSDNVDEIEAMQVEYEEFVASDPKDIEEAIRAKVSKGKKKANGNSPRKRTDRPAAGDSEPDSG